jgi:hypothetical protein
MLLTKLKTTIAWLLVVTALSGVAALIYQTQAAEPPKAQPVTSIKAEPKAVVGDAHKKDADNGDGKKKEAKEGTLLADLEKVDTKERTVTVSRSGTLIGGLGDGKGGGSDSSRKPSGWKTCRWRKPLALS